MVPPKGATFLKIVWNAVFGRLGGAGSQSPMHSEEEEEWEDIEMSRTEEIEKRKRILKGQLARAAAREWEEVLDGGMSSVNTSTCMPVGKETPGANGQRD